MAKLLLCRGKESSKLALSIQSCFQEKTCYDPVRIGRFGVSVSSPPSEDAKYGALQVEKQASRRKIVETRRRLPRGLGILETEEVL